MRGFAAVIAMLKSQFSPTYISGLKKNNFQFRAVCFAFNWGNISTRTIAAFSYVSFYK